jgi:hypothetical protein
MVESWIILHHQAMVESWIILGTLLPLQKEVMWYYCLAGKGTMDITHEWCPKITSGEATSDFGTTSV